MDWLCNLWGFRPPLSLDLVQKNKIKEERNFGKRKGEMVSFESSLWEDDCE
jgi:hypothetical protein